MRYKFSLSDLSNVSNPIFQSFAFNEINGLRVPVFGNGNYLVSPTSVDGNAFFGGTFLMGSQSFWNGVNFVNSIPYFSSVDNVVFFNRFPLTPSFFTPLGIGNAHYDYNLLAIANLGKFLTIAKLYGSSVNTVLGISDTIEDAIKVGADFIVNETSFPSDFLVSGFTCFVYSVVDFIETFEDGEHNYSVSFLKSENSIRPVVYPSCCVLDYSPILRLLGGQ